MVYRPVEDQALANLEREEKLLHQVSEANLSDSDSTLWYLDRQGLTFWEIAAMHGLTPEFVFKRLNVVGALLNLIERGYKGDLVGRIRIEA